MSHCKNCSIRCKNKYCSEKCRRAYNVQRSWDRLRADLRQAAIYKKASTPAPKKESDSWGDWCDFSGQGL